MHRIYFKKYILAEYISTILTFGDTVHNTFQFGKVKREQRVSPPYSGAETLRGLSLAAGISAEFELIFGEAQHKLAEYL